VRHWWEGRFRAIFCLLTANESETENQTILDKIKRHPGYTIIAIFGSVTSILGFLYIFWPKDKNGIDAKFESSPNSAVYQAGRDIVIQQQSVDEKPLSDNQLPHTKKSNNFQNKPVDSLTKNWGVTKEYSLEGEDIIEGWLTADTLTWGASIPLPPLKEPPILVFWRNDGANVEKPKIIEKTTDQFTVTINSNNQTGEWIWRAKGLKKSSVSPAKSIDKKDTFYLPTNKTTEIKEWNIFINLSVPVYDNYQIFKYLDIKVDSPGLPQKEFKELTIGALFSYDKYEIRFMNYKDAYAEIKIIKTDIQAKEPTDE
jgi:hypothetical protein